MLFLLPRRHSVIGARIKPNQIPGACPFGAHMTSGVDFCFFFASPTPSSRCPSQKSTLFPPESQPNPVGRGGSNSEALDPALCIT